MSMGIIMDLTTAIVDEGWERWEGGKTEVRHRIFELETWNPKFRIRIYSCLHSILINQQWRVCFRWHDGDVSDVINWQKTSTRGRFSWTGYGVVM